MLIARERVLGLLHAPEGDFLEALDAALEVSYELGIEAELVRQARKVPR